MSSLVQRMKGVLPALLAGLMMFGMALAPAQAEEELRIVLVSHAPDSDSWWNTVRNALNEAGQKMNVRVEYRNPTHGDLADMARIIEQAIASRPDGIVTTIADYGVLEGVLQRAVSRGIPVVTINSGTEEQSARLGALMHIGQPEYYAGQAAGERAREAGVTSFLCVNHYITNPASVERCQGFADGLGVELGTQMIDADIDPTGVRNRVSAYLRQNPDTQAVLTLGPNSAEPTIMALNDLGRAGDLYFVTFDMSGDIAEAIDSGVIAFAIDQQPYLQGFMPVVVLALYNRYGLLPPGDIRSGPGFITRENLDQVRELAGEIR